MRNRRVLPSPIYPITDPRAAGGGAHTEQVRALLAGGARWLQLRDKSAAGGALRDDLRGACRLARARGARALVNDRADLALAAGAHGVHVGEDDLPAEAARRVLGERAWVGVSTHAPATAEHAARLDVDYVALGPIFPTRSKPGAHPAVGLAGLAEARLRVAAPLVAVGGIGPENLAEVLRAGADAAAMISAVWEAPEGPVERLRALRKAAQRALKERLLAGKHVYLVGFMGAGKSTLGPLLARALARPFVDLDVEIERRAGATIAELFARRGEVFFRRLERQALADAARGRDAVIALGGGALGASASRARVARGFSVWLDAPVGLLRRRCARPGEPERPLLRQPGAFERLYRSRRPLYAASDLRLAAGEAEPPTLAERALEKIRRLGR